MLTQHSSMALDVDNPQRVDGINLSSKKTDPSLLRFFNFERRNSLVALDEKISL